MTISEISGTYGSGIDLGNGNYSNPVTVTSTGSVAASGYGLALVASSSWTVVNAGQISGYWGVDLFGGGSVTNQTGGTITGTGIGIYMGSPGGSVYNQAGATIAGRYGVWINSGTVENAGTIVGALSDDGVLLFGAGLVSNAAGGVITGGDHGIWISKSGSVDNAGSISGKIAGVQMAGAAGAYILNESTGSMVGRAGVITAEASGLQTIVNYGTMTGTAGSGILVQANGTYAGGVSITNAASGAIYGGLDGIATGVTSTKGGNPASVYNGGVISGIGAHGILLAEGGSVQNAFGGSISGKTDGVNVANAAGTVGNLGGITGTQRYGVFMGASGSVTNGSSGVISGSKLGVVIRGASATVENAGSISGGAGSVTLGATGSNHLIVDAGAVFTGKVTTRAATTDNTIELTATNGAGSLSGLGSQYVGFHSVTIDSGATWAVAGTVAGFRNVTIGGMSAGDTLDLTNLAYTAGETATLASGNQLVIRNAKLRTIQVLNLAKTDDLTGDVFHVASDGSTGTVISVTTSGPSSISHAVSTLTEAVAAHSGVLSAFSGSLSAVLQPHALPHITLATSHGH
jgi:hypothetical protein